MQTIADRPIDVLRIQGQGSGPGARATPGEAALWRRPGLKHRWGVWVIPMTML